MFKQVRSDRLRGYVVWGPFLRQDSEGMAERAKQLLPDPRVRHYWDERKRIAVGLVPVLHSAPNLGWDVYLLYAPGVRWERKDLRPPEPTVYMHRKRSREQGIFLSGSLMRKRVGELLKDAK